VTEESVELSSNIDSEESFQESPNDDSDCDPGNLERESRGERDTDCRLPPKRNPYKSVDAHGHSDVEEQGQEKAEPMRRRLPVPGKTIA